MAALTMKTPVGEITIEEKDGSITRIYPGVTEAWGNASVLIKAKQQLEEYFSGKRKTFDLPLAPTGTEFQQKVWQALLDIPYGKTATYGELAEAVGNPKAARAVGMALNKNPIPIIIPCHRIVGKNGTLTGFAWGIEAKKYLIILEQK